MKAVLRRMGLLSVLLPLCALAGCGLYRWEKPGADDNAFQADSQACQRWGTNTFNTCMQARGWVLK